MTHCATSSLSWNQPNIVQNIERGEIVFLVINRSISSWKLTEQFGTTLHFGKFFTLASVLQTVSLTVLPVLLSPLYLCCPLISLHSMNLDHIIHRRFYLLVFNRNLTGKRGVFRGESVFF